MFEKNTVSQKFLCESEKEQLHCAAENKADESEPHSKCAIKPKQYSEKLHRTAAQGVKSLSL